MHFCPRWDLRKDTKFDVSVKSARWDEDEAKWTIRTDREEVFRAKYFLLNTGFAAKRHIPDWAGINSFKGTFLHPSYWPHQEPDLQGKRVAVIGTGSTGVQLASELAPAVGELVVFQRTPNTSLPIAQVDFANGEQLFSRDKYPELFRGRTTSFAGLDYNFTDRDTFDDSPEVRQEHYERLWKEGDFKFWLANYRDMLFIKSANDEAYRFWRDKTRARIQDPRARDLLAPMEPPYAFGLKRVSLEVGFFEIFNKEHVHLVDVNATPIREVTEKGIKTSEKEWEFDFIISATGYDAVTGGLAQIDIRGTSEESLKDHWKNGTYTYFGMACSGFPNMFLSVLPYVQLEYSLFDDENADNISYLISTYGPQAPTAFCNGPTCAQLQGDWIAGVMSHMTSNGLRAIEAERKSEEEWRETVLAIGNSSLLPTTKSVSRYLS